MNRISAIAMSLLLMIGLTAEAHAVTSGIYKCYVFQGPTDDPNTSIVPTITHYNPNATGVQHITRLRILDQSGAPLLDESYAPGTNTVNARGSTFYAAVPTGLTEGLQFLFNWSQAVDAVAPVPKLTVLLFDSTSGIYTSVSQSTCP